MFSDYDWISKISLKNIFINSVPITVLYDFSPLHFGTKLRKAAQIYKTLSSKNISEIVIYGNPNSNYMACFCTYFQSKGWKVVSVFYSKSNYKNLNYWISLKNSNQVFWVNSKQERNFVLEELKSKYFIIPKYGTCLDSLFGVFSLWKEINWNNYENFVLDVGSGITLLSLLHYLEIHSINHVKIIGICIGRSKQKLTLDLQNLYFVLLNKVLDFSKLSLFDPVIDSRFGKYSKTLLEYSKSLLSEGIFLEPIYSAKSLYTLERLVLSKQVAMKNLAYLHQGGILPFYKNFIS